MKLSRSLSGVLLSICSCLLLHFICVSFSFADEQSHYKIARGCAEWALQEKDYFAFIDTLMAESIKQQVVDDPSLLGYQKPVTEIYQQGARDFLTGIKALQSTWDQAARKLMLEFSETELRTLRDYQNKKIGKEFLDTETGRKWQEKAEVIIQSSVDDVRRSLFSGSKEDIYRRAIQRRIDQYQAQGKIPAGLIQSYPKPSDTDLKPADSDKALFQVFEGIPRNPEKTSFVISGEPVLVVSTISDLVLAKDYKGILIRLNAKDTRAFAELTKKFQGKVLFIVCTDKIMEGMRIVAPIEDGCLEFKHPQSAEVAKYLRKRFRIGEFK